MKINLNWSKLFPPDLSRTKLGIFLILLILALVLGGVLYWQHQINQQDNLIKLVPANANLYLHFNYQPNQLTATTQLLFNNLFTDLDDHFLANSPAKLSANLQSYLNRELGLIATPTGHYLLIAKIKNGRELKAQYPELTIFKNHYLILGQDSANSLASDQNQSLGQAQPWPEKYSAGLLQAYFTTQFITGSLTDQPAKDLLRYYFEQNQQQYFQLALDNNLNLELAANANLGELSPLFLTNLNQNTILSLALPSLSTSVSQLGSWLQNFNPNLASTLLQTGQSYLQDYRIDLPSLFSLANHPAQIVVLPDQKYILILEQTTLDELEILDNLLKQATARRFPLRIAKKLPDGTPITELVADPAKFQLIAEDVAGQTIKIIKDGSEIWELAYFSNNNRLIISNSLTDLRALASQQATINLKTLCPRLPAHQLFLQPAYWLQNQPILSKYSQILPNLTLNIQGQMLLGCFF